jgi:photosystem II stability/assembly factor-like uncharacterized protein
MLSLPTAAQEETRHPDDTGEDVNSRAYSLTEKGCRGARILDYLELHGTYGVIDADILLEVTRNEVELRARERESGSAAAVAGSTWTSLGPNNGAGRATAVAIHPTTIGTALIGAAGGGVWKTSDNGANWTALTDSLPNLSVGALSYAPSDASVVYLGTGEGGQAFDFIPGIGLLASTDGGATWNLPPSVLATMFYRISVHPVQANELVIATNRGAMRSENGQNGPWTTVINSGSALGVIGYGDVTDFVRDPSNDQTLYAATWDRQRHCQRFACTDPNNIAPPTVLKSTDGGKTWSPAATGLPVSSSAMLVNRIALAIAPSSPQTLYAAFETNDITSGVNTSRVYKTVDGGANWTETALSQSTSTSISRYMNGQGWYDNAIVVAPGDANVVIAGGIGYVKTIDGGANWTLPAALNGVHVDAHDLRYDAAGTLWVANDGGIWTNTDNATAVANTSNRNTNLVTRQYYAMSQDVVNRNRMMGGTQDNGTNRRTDTGGSAFSSFTGGDGFACLISPLTPSVLYSTFQFAAINRVTNLGAASFSVNDVSPLFMATGDSKPFFTLLLPEPNNPATLYTGTQRVWKSTTAGDAWTPLSTNVTGGAAWNASTVRSIAVAATNPRVMMISKGASVYRTEDGGASWALAVIGLPGRTVTNLEIDPTDAAKAWATIAGMASFSVYSTNNGGTTWAQRSNGLPNFSALVIRFDPTNTETLYAGTDVGVYRTTDSGANWSVFGTGLPAVSVYDIRVMSDGSALRVATHGRGMWELNVTGVTNRVPTVTIAPPSSGVTVARGGKVDFGGTAVDADDDPMSVRWAFSDDWSTQDTAHAASTSHTFYRPGIWPVALSAFDSHGGVGGAEIKVTVTEEGDDCAAPIVIPSAGPFPWALTLNPESATRQTSDPSASCYQFTYTRSVWLSFTPETSGNYRFSLCGSRSAGWISGYTGPACGPYASTGFCLVNTSPDFDCETDTSSLAALTAGTTYRFVMSHYFSNVHGPVTISVTKETTPPALASSVSPFSGSSLGGQTVIVSGYGFVAGSTTVSFGGRAATNVTVLSGNLLTCVTPVHAIGFVDVVVTTPAAAATLRQPYAYTGGLAPAKRRRALR